ncbi:MAG: tripartite tricarboxylate transporter substrate-binding protein [Acidobacteriota bacterium]
MRLSISLAAILLLLGACQTNDEYPSRPILLICPWAVGGGTDTVSRQIAVFLEQELGVPVNVINATGGAGVTGHSRGAQARADGYTLTTMTVELNMLHWRDLTEISWQNFRPVMVFNEDPAAIFVRSDDSRWNDLPSLLEDVQANPGTLTASGTAAGGIWHLALAGSLKAAGLDPGDIRWIPMGGAGPSLQELASGGIDVVSCSLPEATTLLSGGVVRSLGVMSDTRLSLFPDVPTFREQGIDWVMGGWRGLGVPKGTPITIFNRLVEVMQRIMSGSSRVNGRTFPQFMAAQGFNLSWRPPAESQEMLKRFDEELGTLLTSEEFSTVRSSRFQPMDFPRLLFVILSLLLAALIIMGLMRGRFLTVAAPFIRAATVRERLRVRFTALMHFLDIILAVALYVFFAENLGFILTSSAIAFLLLWRLGSRLWVSAVVTVLLVPAVYQLFGNILQVPLPRGLLGW